MKKVPDTSDNFDVKSMLKLVGFVGECGHRRYTLGRSSFFSRLIVPKRSHCKSKPCLFGELVTLGDPSQLQVSWFTWGSGETTKSPFARNVLEDLWRNHLHVAKSIFFWGGILEGFMFRKVFPKTSNWTPTFSGEMVFLPGIFLGAGRWKCLRVVFLG